MKKWPLISFTSAALLVIAAVFFLGFDPKQSLLQGDVLSSSPDYFLTDVQVKVYNQDGTMVERIKASELKHYSKSAKSLLLNPKIERDESPNHWSAKGDNGIIADGSQDILLTGNSEVIRNIDTIDQINLTANQIHYNDSNQQLTSTGKATLQTKQGITSADTIIAHIHTETVSMTGRVRGTYETNQ